MKKLLFIVCLMLNFCWASRAQTAPVDSIPAQTTPDSLLANLLADSSVTAQPLLPAKMIITQKMLWGEKGLFRTTNLAPLTPEGRQRELKIRRTMLVSHQVLGFVTLFGFIAQGIVGSQLYHAKGDHYNRLLNTHSALATTVNFTYGATALLSLTAPPKMLSERKGLSSIKLHKYLAIAHLAGMITTNILANMMEGNAGLKPYHRAAAYTTFGAFALSIIAIKF